MNDARKMVNKYAFYPVNTGQKEKIAEDGEL